MMMSSAVIDNDGSLDPNYERETKQQQYEEVLNIMMNLAGDKISQSYRDEFHLENYEWDSYCTNEVLKTIFTVWEIDKDIYRLADSHEDGSEAITFTCSAILIQDLLEEFTVPEITLYLYKAFKNDSYIDMKNEYQNPSEVELVYKNKLKKFVLKFMGKFNMDKSISDMVRTYAKNYPYTSEIQCRILYKNALIDEFDMASYSYLFSEEFTDYLIDSLRLKIERIYKENKPDEESKPYYTAIYKIMDSRRSVAKSEMFKDKHFMIIKEAAEKQLGNANNIIDDIMEDPNADEY